MNKINRGLEENLKTLQEICVKYDIPVSDKVLTDEELKAKIDSMYEKVINL